MGPSRVRRRFRHARTSLSWRALSAYLGVCTGTLLRLGHPGVHMVSRPPCHAAPCCPRSCWRPHFFLPPRGGAERRAVPRTAPVRIAIAERRAWGSSPRAARGQRAGARQPRRRDPPDARRSRRPAPSASSSPRSAARAPPRARSPAAARAVARPCRTRRAPARRIGALDQQSRTRPREPARGGAR